MKEWVRSGCLPDDADLIADLGNVEYGYDGSDAVAKDEFFPDGVVARGIDVFGNIRTMTNQIGQTETYTITLANTGTSATTDATTVTTLVPGHSGTSALSVCDEVTLIAGYANRPALARSSISA